MTRKNGLPKMRVGDVMRVIVGVTGASGVEMSYYLLKALKASVGDIEIYLILSDGARLTWGLETDLPLEALLNLADEVLDNQNLGACIASGSFRTAGMIVMPCSMKSLAGIVSGFADNLIGRAADVCLKENRRLVLVPREMPFNRIHLRNLKEAADAGCTIVPPMLTFYNGADTIEKQINHVVGKVLIQFDIEFTDFKAWEGAD